MSHDVRNNEAEQRFEIDLGDSTAIADYELSDGTIVFTHTKVPPAHEGQGVGTALIRAALDHARAERLAVVPACPFFAAYMKKHREVQELLDPAQREQLGLSGA